MGGTNLMPPSFFFLANYNYIYIDMNLSQSHIFYKVEIIFPQSLLHYEHNFSTFA